MNGSVSHAVVSQVYLFVSTVVYFLWDLVYLCVSLDGVPFRESFSRSCLRGFFRLFFFFLLSSSIPLPSLLSLFFFFTFQPNSPQQHINNHGNGLQAAPEWADHRQALEGFLLLLAVYVECNHPDLHTY